MSDELQYLIDAYNVPAKIGAKIRVDGKPGTILGGFGSRMKVQIYGEVRPIFIHPVKGVEYLEADA